MNNCFVYETLTDVKQLKKETKNGLMTLSGVFGECGVRNNNNRVYEKSNYGRMVADMKKRIEENGGALPGELEHPSTMNVTLENISHKITDINIDENGLVTGTIQLLNTPKGKIAQSIVEGGLPLFVSSRAQGQIDKSGNVTLEKLATFDLVGTPGFSQARMHLNESQICESLSNNITIIKDTREISEIQENNENNEIDKDMNEELLKRVEVLENTVKELKEENEILRESQTNIDLRKLGEAIQEWVVNDYSADLQAWITEEFMQETNESCKRIIANEAGPLIQKWVIEEVGSGIQKWVVEEFSPEVEKWINEDYTNNLQSYLNNKFAVGIEEWIKEHYTAEIENWINESLMTRVNEKITESLEDTKEGKLKSIQETLTMLKNMPVTKPVYGGRQINQINEAQTADEPLYIQNMPEELRPKYNMASKMVKESIARKASIWSFRDPSSFIRFWNSVSFEEPSNTVTEGLRDLNSIQNLQERKLREAFRRGHIR